MNPGITFQSFETGAAFMAASGTLLRENPAANRWMAGNLAALVRAEQRSPVQGAAFLLWSVHGLPVLAVFLPPRMPAMLAVRADCPEAAFPLVADEMQARGLNPHQITGPASALEPIAAYFLPPYKLELRQVLMVNDSSVQIPTIEGRMRIGVEADHALAIDMQRQYFIEDTGEAMEETMLERLVSSYLRRGMLWFWEVEEHAVSIGTIDLPQQDFGAMISTLFTLPIYRGRGFGAALTLGLNNFLLEKGAEFTCLQVDCAKPGNRKLYEGIGFLPIPEEFHWYGRKHLDPISKAH